MGPKNDVHGVPELPQGLHDLAGQVRRVQKQGFLDVLQPR